MFNNYVIDIQSGNQIWVENEEKAIALVNSYAKLQRLAERIQVEESSNIPF